MYTSEMIGLKKKPFCGNHCCKHPQGSGKAHKRVLKKQNKAKEKQEWRQEALVN